MKRTQLCPQWAVQNALRVLSFVAVLVSGITRLCGQSALDGFDPNANDTVRAIVVQADGKIIIGGDFTSVSPNGGAAVTRNRIARFNPDGTLDTDFNPNANGTVYSIAVTPNGGILAGGDFTVIGENVRGETRNHVAQLNAMTGKATLFNPNANGTVFAIALQPDGKILAGGSFTTIGGQTRNYIARLNTSGFSDSFDPNANSTVYSIALQPDGKILAGGAFGTIGGQTRNNLARLDAASGLADSFNPTANGVVQAIAVQGDGKVLVGGGFTTVGGQMRDHIARLNADGTLDMSFALYPRDPTLGADSDVLSIVVQPDGQILLGGAFTHIAGGQTFNHLARLKVTGAFDQFFDPHANNTVHCLAVQSDGKILAGGDFTVIGGDFHFPNSTDTAARNRMVRLEADGKVDQTLDLSLVGNYIYAVAVQPAQANLLEGGKILIGGNFSQVVAGGQSIPRRNFAQLNSDGTIDTGFFADTDGDVLSIAVQADGKILVGGNFSSIAGLPHNYIARIGENSFDPHANGVVNAIAVQSDGRILVGGGFTSIGGQTRTNLARLNANGSADFGFNPNPNGVVSSIAVQADGNIVVGGEFTSIGGQTRNGIARLDAVTGAADSFNPNADDIVWAIALQTDQKILVGGQFLNIGGQTRRRIARLNSDGTLDSFNADADGLVFSIVPQADGKVLAGGSFATIGGQTRHRIARLDAVIGAADSFEPNADAAVRAIALQPDGKILAGGLFTSIGGQSRNILARISNDTAALSSLVVTRNTITLTRGGSAPQFSHVSFGSDYEFDGIFGLVGNGVPQGSGYTLSGLSFPLGTNFLIRSRGYFRTGDFNGSETTEYKTLNVFLGKLDLVWTNLAGGDWNGVTNWSPNFVPSQYDNATITLGVTVKVNSPADCLSLTLANATLTGSDTLTLHGPSTWTTGTMSGAGRTVIETNATLTIASPTAVSLTGRMLENAGTILWTNSGSIVMNSSAVITNRAGGLFDVQNATQLGFSHLGRFDNAGTFRKSASSGITSVGCNFNNSGTVEVEMGKLLYDGGLTNNGAVNLSAGATNLMQGGGSGSGTFSAPATALVEWNSGSYTLNAGAQLNGDGLYKISSSGNVIANTDLAVTNLDLVSVSAALDGSGVVTIAGAMNWTGGQMRGSGRTIIPAGVTLNAAVANGIILATRTLENGGTVLWTGTTFDLSGSAVITNRAGALFHVQNALPLGSSDPGRFDNAGTFRKSVNTGPTSVGINFNNFGTVDIQTGTLFNSGSLTNSGTINLSPGTTNRMQGGGSSSGTFSAPATALVEWNSGSFALNAGAQLNGAGLYRLNGGNVTASLDLAVENLDLVSTFSTLGGTSTVSVATLMNWTAGTMSGGGRTIIGPGAVMNLGSSSSLGLSSRTVENAGTVFWTGSGSVGLGPGVITNRPGALFHAQNAAQFQAGVGINRFDNAGTFRKSVSTGTTIIQNSIGFNNSGVVEIQTGTLHCNGAFTNNGVVNLSTGTTNRLANGGSASGTFTAPVTALVEWTGGTFTLNPGAQLSGAGLYRLNGGNVTANVDLAVENLDLVSAFSTLSGMSAVSVATLMNWPAGTMSGGGRTIIGPEAVMNLGSSSTPGLSSRTLENAGTVFWTGSGGVGLGPGVITNRVGALFHAQNAAQFQAGVGVNRFDNAGTFRKSVSTGTTIIQNNIGFNNSGTVDIRRGILVANGGYVSTGNALLNCALGGTTAGTGYGQLQVAGAVTLNGSLGVDLINGFVPAMNDTFTVLTAGTRNGSFVNFFYPSNAVTMQLSNTPTAVVLFVTNVVSSVPPPVLLTPQISGTNVALIWSSVSNAVYRLEFKPDLSKSNWTALPGDVVTPSNFASKLDPLTPSNRFYRVRVVP